MASVVYLVIGYAEWVALKESGTYTPSTEEDYHSTIHFLRPHIAKRASVDNYGTPQYVFLERPLAHHLAYFSPPKLAVLKVKVPIDVVVHFDDNVFVCDFVNEIENGHTLCSEEEDLERLFVPKCDKSNLRAFVPVSLITRSSVRKVWVYRKGKRLTRGCAPRRRRVAESEM